MMPAHIPVLLRESCELLLTNKKGKYFEGTLGFGGHTSEFLKQLDDEAIYVASDVDDAAFSFSQSRFAGDGRVRLYKFNFTAIDIMANIEGVEGFDGIFADLGVSSYQLDNSESGFSFREDTPLDMRMDNTLPITAADVLNQYSEEEIADILYKYGEEKNSRKIARLITEERNQKSFRTAADLEKIISGLVPPNFVRKTMTRVFQALRIYINGELDKLEEFLEKSVDLLNPGGRLVVISYHSLEDRIVKDFMKFEEKECICPPGFPICTCGKLRRLSVVSRKPVIPSDEEIKANPRSRSAKLRAAERI